MAARGIESDVISLFPTFVWIVRWAPDLAAQMKRNILACLTSLNDHWPTLPHGTFWQSEPNLQRVPALLEFVSHACTSAQSVLRFLHVADAALDMTGCWINVNAPGSAHAIHNHPNNYLSGVYYLQIAEGANTINFHDPRPQTSVLRPPVTELGGHNADQAVVTVADGTLVLFPAYLPHSVSTNESDQPRVSVSFNLMFADFSQRMSPPQWSGTEAPH